MRVAEAVLLVVLFLLAALPCGALALAAAEMLVARIAGESNHPLEPGLGSFGIRSLAGFGVLAYGGVVLALLGVFRAATVAIGLAAAIIFGWRITREHLYAIAGSLRRLRASDFNILDVAIASTAAVIYAASFLAALAPPLLWDELAYHLPQSLQIVSSHSLPANLGDHYFYGNLPKLMEVLFAEGYVLGGFPLARALHIALFGAFLLFLAGAVSTLFGRRAALVSVLLIVLYRELMYNASSAYVDAAMVAFEVGALLCLALWLVRRGTAGIGAGALLLGFALSVKYSALFMAVFLALALVIVVGVRSRSLTKAGRLAAAAGAVTTVAGGWWYLKNTVLHGNPVYPLYLGHGGVDDETYRALLASIAQFRVPRTFTNFLEMPGWFRGGTGAPLLIAMFAAPLALYQRRRHRLVLIMLLAFAYAFLVYWFFSSSHITRYMMSAGVCLLVALSIGLSGVRLDGRLSRFLAPALVAAIFITAALGNVRSIESLKAQARATLRTPELRVVFGRTPESEYLYSTFGCQYSAIDYLDREQLDGNVMDNWTIWHDPSLAMFEDRNRFLPLDVPNGLGANRVWESVDARDVRYVYIRSGTRERFMASADPLIVRYRQEQLEVEREIMRRASLVWHRDDCQLYRIGAGA